mmetsp:Transcript_5235/g.7718  ORF Transcript_5235/g.7718 Transcript_5235/m.7718 type:complete len:202 (+) Transcript_5235:48-653(+)|eukprot:CAMPEP_0172416238 /NCGR_PEP_ID=MMETSP1064-20121228/2714_1 /TAXON_ID=202472 /ORGANISM="Aulacoseira subarctica , Strain CCAP 1002/5" /LENGTH=201 /DNA_ID=CAMNT_0013153755 /DNA_START=52 /DNA_END=657 /DNA_ORIENTATION=-
MKSFAAIAFLAASANAFTGTPLAISSVSKSTELKMSVWDTYQGGVDFRGKEFKFDPLKLSETYTPLVPFFRESELRHGRTAMLAVVGFVIPEIFRLPGDAYSFEAVGKVTDAHNALIVGPMHQLLLWISLWDIVIGIPAITALNKGEREAGDFGFTWLMPKDEAGKKKRVDQELLNGRLAMMAIGGIATQTVLTGHGFPYL